MYPFLFRATPYEISSWDACFGIGILVTLIFTIFVIKPKDFEMSRMLRSIFYGSMVLVGLFGARLAAIILKLKIYLAHKDLVLPALLSGPVASLGSFFLIIFIIVILSKIFVKNIGALKTLDFLTPILYLQLVFVRIGCFLNGCCYGAYTAVPWGVKFWGSRVHRHPTQLYSLIMILFVILVTVRIYRKNVPPGTAFFSSLSLYSFLRFFIELLRVDSFRVFGKITFAPLFMLALCLSSTIGLILTLKWKRTNTD